MQGREERDRTGSWIHAHHTSKYEHEGSAVDGSGSDLDFSDQI